MTKHPMSEAGRVTKRLVVSLLGCALVWFFLHTHRNWVWAYFDSLMLVDHPSDQLAAVAKESIAAITTIAISGISAVTFIVAWFVTGNVMALTSMFKFSNVAQAAGSVAAEALSQDSTSHDVSEQIIREFGTPELKERYAEK